MGNYIDNRSTKRTKAQRQNKTRFPKENEKANDFVDLEQPRDRKEMSRLVQMLQERYSKEQLAQRGIWTERTRL